jgi:hypothetical protein
MLIATVGLIGSGKDTVADRLVTQYNFKRESFANTLKDAVAAVFGWDRKKLEGLTKEDRAWREQVDQWWAQRLNIPHLTPRWVLQQWGTEVIRRGFHDDMWVASLEHRLLYNKQDVVISDCRFPNEVASIRNVGGKIIRVIRGEEPEWFPVAIEACLGDANAIVYLKQNNVHESEWAWANTVFDAVIVNDGTLEELYETVAALANSPETDRPESTQAVETWDQLDSFCKQS